MKRSDYIEHFLAISSLYFEGPAAWPHAATEEDLLDLLDALDAMYAPALCPDQQAA